jgi:dihydroorotate dehydrogenase subfamily 2
MKTLNNTIHFLYKNLVKKILFLVNPEIVHERTTKLGEKMGKSKIITKCLAYLFAQKNPIISTKIAGISFLSPIGLAAGFDYKAELTGLLPALGFGFGTVGTLTYQSYQGNPGPMLGRLPKSKSLLVNKGFKNMGVEATLKKFTGKSFDYPVGISIGKTNTPEIKTQSEAVQDIVSAFLDAEKSGVPFAYYELNISCPNLFGSIEFYQTKHLQELLQAVQKLNLTRPIFIKMPISKTDQEIISIMDVVVTFPCIKAVIIGNLQTNRQNPAIKPAELEKMGKGNFSGLPCQERSNELIALVYKNYGEQIKIIGCGGTFSAQDAYRKITLGASAVQLITGLIFEGPQLVSQINETLPMLLKKDGFKTLQEAIGSKNSLT